MLDSMMGVRSARVWPHEAAHAMEQRAIEMILNAVMAPVKGKERCVCRGNKSRVRGGFDLTIMTVELQ